MQELYKMKLHEEHTFKVGFSEYHILRVPGGFIYHNPRLDCKQMNSTFVPYNTEFKTKKPSKPKQFIPPTLKEVLDYFKEKGYKAVKGEQAWEYYQTANWKDARGNQVKSWKQKMIAVWMKDEFKLPKNAKPQTQAEEDEEIRKAML